MHVFFFPRSHQHFPKQKARPRSPLFSTPGEEVFRSTSAITEMDKTSATGRSHRAHMMRSTCGYRDSICCLPGELSFSNINEKERPGNYQGLPIHVNAMTALGWRTKDRKMKDKADEPSSVLALVIHFPLPRRFKASATAVNLTSPARGGWFKSAFPLSRVSGEDGKRDFLLLCFFFLSNKIRSCVFNLQDNLVSVWYSLLDCSLMSFLCLIN